MIWIVLAALASATVSLTAEARAAIAPIHAAYLKAEAEQRALPAPKDDGERLVRLQTMDQAGRLVLEDVDLSRLPPEQRKAAFEAMWAEIDAHDRADQDALKRMLPPEGWFRISRYGAKGAEAAFLIVQHATNDEPLMRATLAKLEALAPLGEARGPDFGLMYDRVALTFDHRPQRYGSQIGCKDGRAQPMDLEDPEHVDARRKALGFDETEAEYLKQFATMRCD